MTHLQFFIYKLQRYNSIVRYKTSRVGGLEAHLINLNEKAISDVTPSDLPPRQWDSGASTNWCFFLLINFNFVIAGKAVFKYHTT
jgi:hypothetical protein